MAMRLGQTLRLWTRVVGVTWAAALFAAAGQLGLVYGLAIVRWDRTFAGDTADDWQAQLTWLAWCVALASVIGAGFGARAAGRMKLELPMFAKIGVAVVSGLGAATSIPLIYLPARGAHPPINLNPQLVLVITAGAAAVVGTVLAVFALGSRQFAGGITATAAWVWLFAAFSVWWQLERGAQGVLPRLGVLEVSQLNFAQLEWLPIALSVVVAAIVAAVARFGGARRLHVAAAGFGGPMLLATAYLVAGPGSGTGLPYHTIAYRSALVAAVAGLLVSEVIAFVGRRSPKVPKEPREPREPKAPPGRQVPTNETEYVGWINELAPIAAGRDDPPAVGKAKPVKSGSGRHSKGDPPVKAVAKAVRPVPRASTGDATTHLEPIAPPSDGPIGQPR